MSMYLNGAAKELHHFSRIEGISIEAYYPIARSCNNRYAVNNINLHSQSQETFVQFFNFLRTNLKPEEYMRRMPTASILITEYHMPAESAICLTRPIYMDRINVLKTFSSFRQNISISQASYELSKKNLRETNKSSKTEPSQKV